MHPLVSHLPEKRVFSMALFGINSESFLRQKTYRRKLRISERVSAIQTITLRKEVIQPQVLLRLPCYDFTPITSHTLDGYLLAVELPASSTTGFRDVTGGVYKARERIHRCLLISDY